MKKEKVEEVVERNSDIINKKLDAINDKLDFILAAAYSKEYNEETREMETI